MIGTLKDNAAGEPEEFDVLAHVNSSNSVEELVRSISLNESQRQQLEISTKGQSENSRWNRARQGRLTASNFYAIHTRIESLKGNPQTDISLLVNRILHPSELGHLPQIKHGKAFEKAAINMLLAPGMNIKMCYMKIVVFLWIVRNHIWVHHLMAL